MKVSGNLIEMGELRQQADLPRLTPKQSHFVRNLMQGMTATDAYKGACDCSRMSKEAIWVEASRLKRNPKVDLWLKSLRLAALDAGLITLEQHLAELARARELALQRGQISAAVQAEVARGKVCGLYEDRVRLVRDTSDEELLKVIEEALGPEVASQIARALGLQIDREGVAQTRH